MSNNKGFSLKPFNNIFASTDPAAKTGSDTIVSLELSRLHAFKDHPFKLYEGQRYNDMVESVKTNGVLAPVIVRPIDESDYEILSGHNRVEAAKAAKLEVVPAIVRRNLSDEEALLIVTETNLLQRSFADMSHSERATTLAAHHEAIKKQGKRNDLIKEIENMINTSNYKDEWSCSPVGNKYKTIEKVGHEYGLAKNSVARYLRVNKLIVLHKTRLDNGELSMRAAVTLSYLTGDEQHIVDDVIKAGKYRLDMKKAEALRRLSEKGTLNEQSAVNVLAGVAKPKNKPRNTPFKVKSKIIAKFFKPEMKAPEIEAAIEKALDYYFNRR